MVVVVVVAVSLIMPWEEERSYPLASLPGQPIGRGQCQPLFLLLLSHVYKQQQALLLAMVTSGRKRKAVWLSMEYIDLPVKLQRTFSLSFSC